MITFKPLHLVVTLGVAAATASFAWLGFSSEDTAEVDRVASSLGACQLVSGVGQMVDIEPVTSTAAFVATISDSPNAEGDPRGRILLFDTAAPIAETSWTDRTGGSPGSFVPGGIDLYQSTLPDGRVVRRLFVVNEAAPEVLLFDIDTRGDLSLRERFRDPRLTSPQDIVATGARSFFVSNASTSPRGTLRHRADYLFALRNGMVLHYDGASWTTALDGLRYPSGVALSDDGSEILVAEARGRQLVRLTRADGSDHIRLAQEVALHQSPDKLIYDTDGHVLVGLVASPFNPRSMATQDQRAARANVVKLTQGGDIVALFENDSDIGAAATLAAHVGSMMVVGSQSTERLLMCDAEGGERRAST